MRFIERLKEEEKQIKARQKAEEEEGLRRRVAEEERSKQRTKQAERFREESRVGLLVTELGKILKTSGRLSRESRRQGGSKTDLGLATDLINQRDPDSVFDLVAWDKKEGGRYNGYAENYIVVESCPDGSIVFHGGWYKSSFESTTIQPTEWRTQNKEQIFNEALEKAFKNPVHFSYDYPRD